MFRGTGFETGRRWGDRFATRRLVRWDERLRGGVDDGPAFKASTVHGSRGGQRPSDSAHWARVARPPASPPTDPPVDRSRHEWGGTRHSRGGRGRLGTGAHSLSAAFNASAASARWNVRASAASDLQRPTPLGRRSTPDRRPSSGCSGGRTHAAPGRQGTMGGAPHEHSLSGLPVIRRDDPPLHPGHAPVPQVTRRGGRAPMCCYSARPCPSMTLSGHPGPSVRPTGDRQAPL
jgi:hypothetical protein